MDPAGVGALIGVSIMVSVCIGFKVCDYQTKKKARQAPQGEPHRIPKSSFQEEKRSILVIKRQWKMKDLKLPHSYILNNLSIRKF